MRFSRARGSASIPTARFPRSIRFTPFNAWRRAVLHPENDSHLSHPSQLSEQVKVLRTRSCGVQFDVDVFLADIARIGLAAHTELARHAVGNACC